jgi:hypothetical protein
MMLHTNTSPFSHALVLLMALIFLRGCPVGITDTEGGSRPTHRMSCV